MNIGKLRQLLVDFSGVLAAAASPKPAEDLARLASLMNGRDNQSAEKFLDELQQDARPLTPAELIAAYIRRLSVAGIDEFAFREVFETLSKDKVIKKVEAERIAHGYIGGRDKWSSKGLALDAIEKEFVARRYDSSKMKEVSRSRPW